MTPSRVRATVVAEKSAWVRTRLDEIRDLPLDRDTFFSDPRNAAAAESYLRRAIEGLLDLGRHIAARGFGTGVLEYKEIPRVLEDRGVVGGDTAAVMGRLAGYRNRMVHFYAEVTPQELFTICSSRLDDVERILDEILAWLRDHPESVDRSL